MSEIPFGIDTEIERLQQRSIELTQLKIKLLAEPDLYAPFIEQATRVWGGDAELIWTWFCRPMLRLDDRTPLAMIAAGEGQRVKDVLGALEYGVYL
jgi:uncharacterized protein (DUF2384 family)